MDISHYDNTVGVSPDSFRSITPGDRTVAILPVPKCGCGNFDCIGDVIGRNLNLTSFDDKKTLDLRHDDAPLPSLHASERDDRLG